MPENGTVKRPRETFYLLGIGIICISTVLTLVFWKENINPTQQNVVWAVLALGCAALGALLPGALNIELPTGIKAGGALGIFVLVFMQSPATTSIINSPSRIGFAAADYRELGHGRNIWVDTVTPCRFGLVYNAPNFEDRPNEVFYRFDAVPGTYYLVIEYASEERRPVKIDLNGSPLTGDFLSQSSGSYCREQTIADKIAVTLKERNTLKIYRDHPFPHLKTIEFVPAT
jgi:hypothetical protein